MLCTVTPYNTKKRHLHAVTENQTFLWQFRRNLSKGVQFLETLGIESFAFMQYLLSTLDGSLNLLSVNQLTGFYMRATLALNGLTSVMSQT